MTRDHIASPALWLLATVALVMCKNSTMANTAADIWREATAPVPSSPRSASSLTSLAEAMDRADKPAFESLLSSGANPNTTSPQGDSVLFAAAKHEDPWFLEQCLKSGADANLVNPATGETVIFQSIRALRPENTRLLAAAGARMDTYGLAGHTPLTTAASLNRYDMVLYMLQAGADPHAPNAHGATLDQFVNNNRIDPRSENFQWLKEVRQFLKSAPSN